MERAACVAAVTWMWAGAARAQTAGERMPRELPSPSAPSGQEATPRSGGEAMPSSGETPRGAIMAQLTTLGGTVEKIDKDKRELTIKGDNGKTMLLKVPESVTGFEKVKTGQHLSVDYYQAVALSLHKPGTEQVGTMAMVQSQPGMTVEKITSVGKIVKIDRGANEVTIEGPNGQRDTITVKDPDNQSALKSLKAGDQVQLTYARGMVVSLGQGQK